MNKIAIWDENRYFKYAINVDISRNHDVKLRFSDEEDVNYLRKCSLITQINMNFNDVFSFCPHFYGNMKSLLYQDFNM